MPMTVPNNAPMAPVPPSNNPLYPPRTYLSDFSGNMRSLPGYFIQNDSEIIPKYIPTDGSIAFFPYRDLSRITIKQWDSNGINTLEYVIAPPRGGASGNANNIQTPDGQNADQLPLSPSVEQRPDPTLELLQQLNNGLANTFTQFGATLQAIQQEINQMNTMIGNAWNGELGGRG